MPDSASASSSAPGSEARAPVRVALVGAGRMAEVHAAALAANPRFGRLVAVHGRRSAPAKKLAKAFGCKCVGDYQAMLDDPSIDALVIATPTATHKDFALAALAAGKHLLIEKPLALNTPDAAAIVHAADAGTRVVMVAQCVRWFQEVRALIGKLSEIGTPRTARASRVAANPGSWYIDAAQSGGVCFDLMVHDFDLLRWCFGEVERVYALATSRDRSHPEMYAQVSLRHKSGVISYVEGSWMHPSGFSTSVEFAGSEGLLSFERDAALPLRYSPVETARAQQAGAEIPSSPFLRSPYDLQMEAFLVAAAAAAPPPVSARDGYAAVAIAEAARASIASGKCEVPLALAQQTKSRGARK